MLSPCRPWLVVHHALASPDTHACRLVLSTPVTPEKPWALLTFCVETEEGAQKTSERLDAMQKPMLRILPDGQHLTWRVAAMSRFDEPGRAPKPFFITWDDPTHRPDKVCPCVRSARSTCSCWHACSIGAVCVHVAQRAVDHKVQPVGFEYVELAGDQKAMEEWIGTDKLPLRWTGGAPGIKAVGIKTAAGDTIVLR